ncbi:hypothetical protein [Mycobacterium sp. 1482292.6]|uniref:hypothetical protein n=1 Tax=Mycobacterium sp. 1482292.6 TaxID=1834081 RepID=UPI000A42B907|nr:hypothetical protein [Mycobacterium sp. 1482292.6]
MDDEQSDTQARGAHEETEIISDHPPAETQGRAWSNVQDEDDEEPERHPWSAVTGPAAALITAGTAVATVVAVLGWIMLHRDHPPPAPSQPSPTAEKPSAAVTPPPPVTVTAAPTTQAAPTTTLPPASDVELAPADLCNAGNAAKLAYDPNSGHEVVCVNQGLIVDNGPPSWQWAQPPPMTSGRNSTGTVCDPRGQNMSRSTDGYLIVCRSDGRSGPGVGYWEHFLGPIE